MAKTKIVDSSGHVRMAMRRAEALSHDDYRAALLQRETARLHHARIAPLANGIITLSCPGPAPIQPKEPLAAFPTGNAVFNCPSSMLFAPVATVPPMSVAGMPVGLQVMGQQHEDAGVRATAR